jgi:hypothetical protein
MNESREGRTYKLKTNHAFLYSKKQEKTSTSQPGSSFSYSCFAVGVLVNSLSASNADEDCLYCLRKLVTLKQTPGLTTTTLISRKSGITALRHGNEGPVSSLIYMFRVLHFSPTKLYSCNTLFENVRRPRKTSFATSVQG